jgi:hypothetical protein
MSEAPGVPTERDWGDYLSDPDRENAHDVFAGKTRAEVLPDFEESAIERADELRFMPPVPFRYYVLALRDFVLSPDLVDDHPESWAPDAAAAFLDLVREKLEEEPAAITPVLAELMPALEHVAAHQSIYKAAVDEYGDFRETLARIKALAAS